MLSLCLALTNRLGGGGGGGGGAVVECHRIVMDHFTVMSLVPSPLSESEAEIDLDLVPTSFLFL